MTTSDIIASVSSVISLITLVVSWKSSVRSEQADFNANEASKIANEASKIASQAAAAGSETAVLALINQARMRSGDVNLKLQDVCKGRLPSAMTADEKRYVQGIESSYFDAVETLLNSYELACGMYRDSKLDRERFRRQYGDEIKKLFENGTPAYKGRLEPISSPYKAMRAVYEEWFNPEK